MAKISARMYTRLDTGINESVYLETVHNFPFRPVNGDRFMEAGYNFRIWRCEVQFEADGSYELQLYLFYDDAPYPSKSVAEELQQIGWIESRRIGFEDE